MNEPWSLSMDESLYQRLMQHLFPGDADEHGAVIAAGVVTTSRGTRLLARQLFEAQDGVDFVPGRRGYRMLTAEFVREKIVYCRDEKLAYLAIHNHGGRDSVGFSEPDNRSHERGYPALLDISGQPVGALVLAENAVAGDIWTEDRERHTIKETVVLGRNRQRLYPSPLPQPPKADPTYDRQARWFGDRGQHLLAQMKIGVVGAGGVGLPLTTMLGRLGVGHIAVIDPERLDPTNLPRMPEARRLDAMMQLRAIPGLSRLANHLSTRKVDLARRAVRRANPMATFLGLSKSVIEPDAARELIDCDFIFLAADSHLARMIVNAIAYQFLIPAVQIGTRIDVNPQTGAVGEIRSNVRLILPHAGCLRCNDLINGTRLQEEAIGKSERERIRYVDEIPAPSVITFNTLSAAQAVTDFMLMAGDLIDDRAPIDYLRFRPRERKCEPIVPQSNRNTCRDCGLVKESRRARGDGAELPLPRRG
jgi:molybdopterin/thiamine biosynthesis adenylyltransferase